jgi:hypothetical protein
MEELTGDIKENIERKKTNTYGWKMQGGQTI